MDRQALIERYATGHQAVLDALRGITDADLDARKSPDQWTAREVVHHLADSEMTSAIRLRRLLVEDHPEIPNYDEEAFAKRLHYTDRPIEAALDALSAARRTTLEILERMTEQDWQRSGTHSESGPYSAETWLEIYASHAHDHAAQIKAARTGSRQHRVGFAWVWVRCWRGHSSLSISPILPRGDVLPEAVFAVALAAVLTYLPFQASQRRLEQVAWAVALVGVAGGLIRVPFLVGGYETTPASATWMAIAQIALLVLVLLMAPPVRTRLSTRTATTLLSGAVACAVVLGAALIVGVPDPQIDVFYFLNEGARGLAAGQNPYALQFTGLPPDNPGYLDPAYHFDVYSYLPGMLLLSLPTVPLGDVRWLLLAAIPVSGVLPASTGDARRQLPRDGRPGRARLRRLPRIALRAPPGLARAIDRRGLPRWPVRAGRGPCGLGHRRRGRLPEYQAVHAACW